MIDHLCDKCDLRKCVFIAACYVMIKKFLHLLRTFGHSLVSGRSSYCRWYYDSLTRMRTRLLDFELLRVCVRFLMKITCLRGSVLRTIAIAIAILLGNRCLTDIHLICRFRSGLLVSVLIFSALNGRFGSGSMVIVLIFSTPSSWFGCGLMGSVRVYSTWLLTQGSPCVCDANAMSVTFE